MFLLPRLSAIRAAMLILLFFEPFVNAVHVKLVTALALNGCAIIPAKLALPTRQFKLIQANSALVIIRLVELPFPSSNSQP